MNTLYAPVVRESSAASLRVGVPGVAVIYAAALQRGSPCDAPFIQCVVRGLKFGVSCSGGEPKHGLDA